MVEHSAIVVDFSQVRQDLIDNSGGQVNSSSIITGSDITINSDESFALVDESFGYSINVRGSLAIAINNDFENRREVNFRVSGTSSSDKLHGSIDNAMQLPRCDEVFWQVLGVPICLVMEMKFRSNGCLMRGKR